MSPRKQDGQKKAPVDMRVTAQKTQEAALLLELMTVFKNFSFDGKVVPLLKSNPVVERQDVDFDNKKKKLISSGADSGSIAKIRGEAVLVINEKLPEFLVDDVTEDGFEQKCILGRELHGYCGILLKLSDDVSSCEELVLKVINAFISVCDPGIEHTKKSAEFKKDIYNRLEDLVTEYDDRGGEQEIVMPGTGRSADEIIKSITTRSAKLRGQPVLAKGESWGDYARRDFEGSRSRS